MVAAGALATLGGAAVASSPSAAYSSIPAVLPGNVVSLGYAATSTSEFGDHVGLTVGSGRVLTTVTVVLSSWGCESGGWSTGDCVTTPGATFDHPITLTLYNVAGGPTVGTAIVSSTQTFTIPYRPSADTVNCVGGRWYNAADTTCYNGFATTITFDLSAQNVVLPDEVIWGVAYNTSHYGAAPIGTGAACYTESGGCGYDSLNVGAETLALVGTDVDPDGAFLDSTYGGAYCDSGAGGTGTFREDSGPGCWADYRPMIEINTRNWDANDCKKAGWQNFTNPSFKNQGQCVSHFARQ